MSELDRHITGNYGENQFKRTAGDRRAFWRGRQARKRGKKIASCQSSNVYYRSAWRAGWADEDMAIAAELSLEPTGYGGSTSR